MRVDVFVCDACGKPSPQWTIDDPETGQPIPCPLVVYTVVGVPPNHGTVDVTDVPLPPVVRQILELDRPRREWCVRCWMAEHGADQVQHLVRPPRSEESSPAAPVHG